MNNEQLKTKKLEDIFPKVNVIDNLVSDNTETPLSAKQGKVLKDIIQTNKDDVNNTIQDINGRISFLNDLTAIHSGNITSIGTRIDDINKHLTRTDGNVDDIREDIIDINSKLADKNSIKDLGYFRLDNEAFAKASERSITENLDICFIVWKTDSTNGIIYQQRKSLYYVKQVLFFVGACECKLRLITTGDNYHVGEWQNFNVLIRPEFDNKGWLIDRGPVNSGGFGPFPVKRIAQLQLANNMDGSIGAINNKQYNKIAQMDMSDAAKITGDCTTLLGKKEGVAGGTEAIRIGSGALIEEDVYIGGHTNIGCDLFIGSNVAIDNGVHIIKPAQVNNVDIESTDLTIYPGAVIGTNFIQTTNDDSSVNRISFKGQNNYIEKCNISNVRIGKTFDQNKDYSVIIGEQVNINNAINIGSDVYISGGVIIGSDTFIEDNAVNIGRDVNIHDHTSIGGGVYINNNTYIGSDVYISGGVTIGSDTSIEDNVYIGSSAYIYGAVFIGSNVIDSDIIDIRDYSSVITKGVYIGTQLNISNAYIGSDYHVYIGGNTVINGYVSIQQGVQLGDNVKVGKNVTIGTDNSFDIVRAIEYSNYISKRVYIGSNIKIDSDFADKGYVHIGWIVDIDDNVTIGSNVSIKKGITINDDAVIGTNTEIGLNAKIGDSVTIGNNLVIGSNSILEKNSHVYEDVNIGTGSLIGNNAVIGNKAVIADGSKLLKNVIIGTDSTNTPNMINIDNYNGPVDIKGAVYISTNVNIGYDTNIGNNATLPNNFNVSIENDKLKLVIGEKTLYLSFEEQPQTNNV